MKLIMSIMGTFLVGVGFFPISANAAEAALKTDKEKISYSIGAGMGKNLKANLKDAAVDLDADLVGKAIKSVLADEKLLMSDADMQATISGFNAELKQRAGKVRLAKGEENKKKGEAFLAENKKNKDVVTTASGLQYKILKAGNGKKPTAKDSVEVNYKGTLIDGTVFDASQEGKPVSFPLGNVIPGWTEALQLMPAGSKWQLVIPSHLAYGEQGYGNVIAPNATLIFEVELVSVK